MEAFIGWFGVGLGFFMCIGAFLMAIAGGQAQAGESGRIKLGAVCAVIATLIFWAVAMQKQPPFSWGQGLAYGFLIGGVLGTIALFLCGRFSSPSSDQTRRIAAHSLGFLALFGVSLTYVIFKSDPYWALIGFSIGAVMAAAIQRFMLDPKSFAGTLAEFWALFGVTISTAILLAMQHFDKPSLRMWWSLPILLAATVLLASFVGADFSFQQVAGQRPQRGYPASVTISVLLVLGLSAIYSWRITHDWRLLAVVAGGMLVAGLVAWISHGAIGASRRYRLDAASASVLLITAFAVAAFKLWAGFGIAMGLIAARLILLQLFEGDDSGLSPVSTAVNGALMFGLAMSLFKLFTQVYVDSLGGLDPRIHYTFISAILGITLPFFVISSLARINAGNSNAKRVVGIAIIGLLTAAFPIALLLIWGIKGVLGLMFGLTAGMAFLLILRLNGGPDENPLYGFPVGLVIIGAQLSAIEFVKLFVDLELARSVRIWILVAMVVIAAVWYAVSGFLSPEPNERGR